MGEEATEKRGEGEGPRRGRGGRECGAEDGHGGNWREVGDGSGKEGVRGWGRREDAAEEGGEDGGASGGGEEGGVHGVVVTVGGGRIMEWRLGVKVDSFDEVLLPSYGPGEVRRSEHPRPPHRRAAHCRRCSFPLGVWKAGSDGEMATGPAQMSKWNLLGLIQNYGGPVLCLMRA